MRRKRRLDDEKEGVFMGFGYRVFSGGVLFAAVLSAGVYAQMQKPMSTEERQQYLEKLQQIRQMGARVAIDDFGTGFCSFSYLLQYPVDRLKIDQSFVAGLVDNPEDATIVDAVVRLAHSFGLETVAAGLVEEDPATARREHDGNLAARCRPGRELGPRPAQRDPQRLRRFADVFAQMRDG